MAMKRIIIINVFRKHGRVKREIKRSPSSKSGRDTSGNRRCAQQDQGDLRLLKKKILLIFVSFRWQGRCLECWWWTRRGCPSRPPWTAPPLPYMAEWWLLRFSIFSRFFPIVAKILHLFFYLLLTITCTCRWVGWQILQSLLWGTLTMACSEYLKFSGTFFYISRPK